MGATGPHDKIRESLWHVASKVSVCVSNLQEDIVRYEGIEFNQNKVIPRVPDLLTAIERLRERKLITHEVREIFASSESEYDV